MELRTASRLYKGAVAARRLAYERLEERTQGDYTSSLRRFTVFCEKEGCPNPLEQRFIELPSVLAAYIHQLAGSNSSQWSAEKIRAALPWYYSRPDMIIGGHPHDKWVIETHSDRRQVTRGNPA
ncbi:hypothetical protein PybrP1_005961 [[Pythium] brassicae (nom. inval.)]|nr:hypothetical protein PybrP1_005961 [[Pythium] brassicae (nom. inval.)]